VDVASGDTVEFTHGGLHVMLMDLTEPMLPGDVIPVVLHTNAGDVSIEFTVAEEMMMPHSMKEKEHSGHGSHMKHGDSKTKDH